MAGWAALNVAAQFSGLAVVPDGSGVYFTSSLRLKGSAGPLNGKVFLATPDEVRLVSARETEGVAEGSPLCTVGGFRDYVGAEASAGPTALFYYANALSCSYPPYRLRTRLVTPSGGVELAGVARVSANGAWAVVYAPRTGRPTSAVDVTFIDLATGARTPVPIASPGGFEYVQAPYSGGRMVANDGTALLGFSSVGYLLKPGGVQAPFPVEGGVPVAISANAAKVLYYAGTGFFVLDLGANRSTLVVSGDRSLATGFAFSEDGSRLIYVSGGRVHLASADGATDRVLAADAGVVTEAAISPDGKAAWAVTDTGGLLRIDVDAGSSVRLIGRTPFLRASSTVTAGLAPIFGASGMTEATIEGSPPFDPYLGAVTMWMGERKVPLIYLTPTSLRFLVPWDYPAGTARVLAEVAGDRTPFDVPQVETTVGADDRPTAGAIAREDWTQTYVGPIRTGEIIHVFGIGLGAVSPEPPPGAAAPSSEPLARVVNALACSNAEVLYAGLAPGTVERVYQVDLRIGPVAGYQKFTCTLGGGDPFIFLTLNIVD